MNNISRRNWVFFFLLSLLSLFVWFKFLYPQLVFSNLKIDRQEALDVAKAYLAESNVTTGNFQEAIVFTYEQNANQYLQSAVGFKGLERFIAVHDFDMFFWLVRFYKEKDKEEYRIAISSQKPEVISAKHVIDDSQTRRITGDQEARGVAEDFLKKRFQYNLADYELADHLKKVLDHRVEYAFTWQKKGVNIAWSSNPVVDGSAKLLMTATVAGEDVLGFAKNSFIIPDQFNRKIARLEDTGRIWGRVISGCYMLMFVAAVFFILSRRNHLAMHLTKNFYIGVVGLFMFIALISELNDIQYILYHYRNTSPFELYLWEHISDKFMSVFFATMAIIIPALAGELLHFEVFRKKAEGSFLYYVQTTFFSREVAQGIFLGYFVCWIMLGLQSLMIFIGQKYFGVWIEHNWMARFSTSYVPALTAFAIGYRASFNEEIWYRLFATSLGKKIFKNTFFALLLASVIWGFGHTGYPVYPKWFRGLEMTCLGLFLSFVYLRFGIIPVLVGHFLFNVFWNSADYLFGVSPSGYFWGSLSVFLIPLALGMVAFLVNKRVEEKTLQWRLNKHQLYNLNVLKSYLETNQKEFIGQNKEAIVKQISGHGWDLAVVEVAVEQFEKERK